MPLVTWLARIDVASRLCSPVSHHRLSVGCAVVLRSQGSRGTQGLCTRPAAGTGRKAYARCRHILHRQNWHRTCSERKTTAPPLETSDAGPCGDRSPSNTLGCCVPKRVISLAASIVSPRTARAATGWPWGLRTGQRRGSADADFRISRLMPNKAGGEVGGRGDHRLELDEGTTLIIAGGE